MTKVLKVVMLTEHQARHLKSFGNFKNYQAPVKPEAFTVAHIGEPALVTGIKTGGAPVPDPDPVEPGTTIPTEVGAGSDVNFLVSYQSDGSSVNLLGVDFTLVDKVSLKETPLKVNGKPTAILKGTDVVEDSFNVTIPTNQAKGFYYLKIEVLYKLPKDTNPSSDAPYMPLIEIK